MKTVKYIILPATALLLLASCGNGNGDYDASGVFETTEVLVSAEASGKLLELKVEEGQQMTQGTVVGYIDTMQLHLQKMQILANNSAVLSRYVNIPKQIASIRQQIATQKTELVRFQNLVKSNAANQKQVDDINSQILILQRELAAQIERLENSNQGVTRESSSLDVQVARLDDMIAKSYISSPITGTVLGKYAEQGELANQGRALFKLGDVNNMFLRAYITASQLTGIQLGQDVKVYSDLDESDRREYQGIITWISDKAEFTPKTIQTRDERANLVYAIKVAVKNDGYIKRGMYGEMKFENQ